MRFFRSPDLLEKLDENPEDDAQEELVPDRACRENVPKRDSGTVTLGVREVIRLRQNDTDEVERQTESEQLLGRI